jgi:hypothetical protein
MNRDHTPLHRRPRRRYGACPLDGMGDAHGAAMIWTPIGSGGHDDDRQPDE